MDLNKTVALKVEKPGISVQNLAITFDEKATKILKDREVNTLNFDIELIEENCARIFNPVIKSKAKSVQNSDSGDLTLQLSEPIPLTINITPLFSQNFPSITNLEITSSGWIRKTLIFGNLEPKIIKVC